MSRIPKSSLAVILGAAVIALSARAGGSTTTVDTATEGQQLLDLRRALDAGAISEEEYERERQEILRD